MRLVFVQRLPWASSQTLAIVISSFAPGAAATKYWKADERVRIRAAGPPTWLAEPLLERELRVDRDRVQVLGQRDLVVAPDPAWANARDMWCCSATSQMIVARPAAAGGQAERRGDGRLAHAALAGDVDQVALEQWTCHAGI